MVGKSDFNENPVVSPDLDLDLGFVNFTIFSLMTVLPPTPHCHWQGTPSIRCRSRRICSLAKDVSSTVKSLKISLRAAQEKRVVRSDCL